MRTPGQLWVIVATALVVLGGCTSDATEDPTEQGPTTASSDDATGSAEDDASTPDEATTGDTSGGSDDDTGEGAATDDDADDTSDQTVAAPSVTEIPNDASEPDEVLPIIDQLYALEHPVRVALADRAQEGDDLADVDELTELFEATRTADAAAAEAEAVADLGGENLALYTESGVLEPSITDVEVEQSRTGCVVMLATTDLLTTYNDQGQLELRFRLVTGEGNDTGWLIDRISTGEVPGC